MDEILSRMAKQLDSLDEESLLGLWEKYARIVDVFEPSDRWQEAVLILSFIQAKMWKNQLFNQQWAAHTKLQGRKGSLAPIFALNLEEKKAKKRAPAVSISFSPKNTNDDTSKEDK